MRRYTLFVALLLATSLVIPLSTLAEDTSSSEETYRIYGSVFNSNGEAADSTSLKVDSLDSVWSVDGAYELNGITPGEHVIRAYFMNDGHTVVYRTINVDGDLELDFYQGKNWITGNLHAGIDHQIANSSVIYLDETSENRTATNGTFEFGPLKIGDYYTLYTNYDGSDETSQTICFKLEEGSSSSPKVNHFELYHGMNNIYGYILDSLDLPVSGVQVSNGDISTLTNSDGFFLLRNLSIGGNETLTLHQDGIELMPPVQHVVSSGQNWLNLTSIVDVEFPHNVTFLSQMETVIMSPFNLEWAGGDYTDYYSLYRGEISEENLLYRGPYESFEYTPLESGTHEFKIVSHNINGTNENSPSLLMIVLPNPTNDQVWQAGMSWDYSISHTPEYFHNRTYTMIGTETISDAFNRDQETFLVRITDDTYQEGEKAFRWFDASNLLPVKTYWVDAPESSSYFQEGTMGWDFTNSGEEAAFFSELLPESLHFNRTNIIGVPGHPNGYDDTQNTVSIQENVEITVLGQTFLTTYITITDSDDGVVSWELWYNSTVRNYVKIVDRLPGSHSDSVMYELSGYDIPTKPKFITESSTITSKDYTISWASFPSATLYQLIQNGAVIYEGDSTSFDVESNSDGNYVYSLNTLTDIGYLIEGDEIQINVDFIPITPVIDSIPNAIGNGESLNLSWSSVPDAEWYSVIVQDAEGDVVEMYNGSDNFTTLEDMSTGQNRLRVNVMVSGKISEYSSSVFVTIDEIEKEDEGFLPFLSLGSIVLVILTSTIMFTLWRNDDDV
tara:strand:+ start:1331 stop:3685 length:2355 start_codon:yes stop_codon:yes gene_type:complete